MASTGWPPPCPGFSSAFKSHLQPFKTVSSSCGQFLAPAAKQYSNLFFLTGQNCDLQLGELSSTLKYEKYITSKLCFLPSLPATSELHAGVPAQLLQLCSTLCDSMGCSPPGSFIHGILQAKILLWVAMPFSREYSQPRDWTHVTCIAGGLFTTEL